MDTPSILVVDDTPFNLKLLSTILGKEGYEVRGVLDGQMALKTVYAKPPDLILLDIGMPNLDGYEVCQTLKQNPKTHDIPVMFISASDEVIDKVKAFSLGGVDYITKPFQVEEVLARVKNQLTLCYFQKQLRLQNLLLQQEIQERQRAEAEALRLLSQEKELSALKSRFVRTVSHEFRTPLATIFASSDLLRRFHHRLSEADRQERLDKIQASVKNMTSLLDDVLLLAKAEAGRLAFEPQLLRLGPFISSLLEEVSLSLTPQHTLEFSYVSASGQSTRCHLHEGQTSDTGILAIDPSKVIDLELEADDKLLRQILTNLLSNAIKYSPGGGRIQLEIVTEVDQICFKVQDEGIGISPADQQHLFEEFFRASNVTNISGIGLGLSIIRHAVTLHGGQITFESELEVGSTFRVYLPLRQPLPVNDSCPPDFQFSDEFFSA